MVQKAEPWKHDSTGLWAVEKGLRFSVASECGDLGLVKLTKQAALRP